MSTVSLPQGWSRRRLRFDARMNPVKSELELPEDAEVSFVPMEALGEFGGMQLDQTKTVSDVYNGYTYFVEGDVCVAKITPCFENGKGALAVGLTNDVGFGTTELHVIRPHNSLDRQFLFYISISHDFRKLGASEMLGAGGQKRVPEAFVKNWRAPIPPIETQKRIAVFLDAKTAQIDALIAKKRTLLERLAEKRQAIVTQAVTKGINPAAPMMESGVEWLGQVPAHWSIRKIKYGVRHVVDCLHTTPHYDGDLLYPAIRTADVDRGRLLLDQARLVSDEVYFERIQRLKPIANDILYSREGERFGMAALVPDGIDLCLGQRMMMFHVRDDSHAGYLMWALNSEAIYQQVTLYAGGSTSPHVNIGDIINFFVPHPPRGEQCQIASAIFERCAHIEEISAKVQTSLEQLSEHRSALITAAVIGEIEGLR
jgi:type I restriction enzyme S subunit